MKKKSANCAFLLLLLILLMAWQMRPAFCSPDLLYLRTGTVPDSPAPSPSGEQLHWDMGTVLASTAVDSSTTDVYWYSQRYTGTVSSGDWTLYSWQKRKSAPSGTVNYILEIRASDGTLVSTIATVSSYVENSNAFVERTITFSSVAETSFNDERLCLHIQYVSGKGIAVQYNYDSTNSANSRIVTPTGSPPIPEFPSFDGSQMIVLIVNLIGIAFFLKRFKKTGEKKWCSA